MIDFLDRQHICPVLWTSISTHDCYCNWYKLCFTNRWFVSTLVWDRQWISKWAWSKGYYWLALTCLPLTLTFTLNSTTTAKNRKKKKTLDDKCEDFRFPMAIFPFISSNISGTPTYGVSISRLLHYSRDCSQYSVYLHSMLIKCINFLQFKTTQARRYS